MIGWSPIKLDLRPLLLNGQPILAICLYGVQMEGKGHHGLYIKAESYFAGLMYKYDIWTHGILRICQMMWSLKTKDHLSQIRLS